MNFRKEPENFDKTLPAVCLVFGGSFLDYNNAPMPVPDEREQTLVDLLLSYLENEVTNAGAGEFYKSIQIELTSICKILREWSQDLDSIYHIRDAEDEEEKELYARKMAVRLLKRIQNFENCTIIPCGLISTQHTHKIVRAINGCHDHVNVAILKKKEDSIDWAQVDPGSAYHQHCPSLAGNESNSVLEITDISPDNITEDWLYLLVSLKGIHPGEKCYYKEVSLYECLLVHLNGKTVFQSDFDEGFISYCHISPTHTWEVVEQSFQYLLRHFLGDTYRTVFNRLLTGFKLLLVEETFAAYQKKQSQLRHFLLQEMCRDIAQQALDQGDEEQKAHTLKLIDKIKAATKEHCIQLALQTSQDSHLTEPFVSSLSFLAPDLIVHIPSSNNNPWPSLKVRPEFVIPNGQGDMLACIQQFKSSFIDELVDSDSLEDLILLSYGMEVFFIDYLAKSDILTDVCRVDPTGEGSSFCRDNTPLAKILLELAELFHHCQIQLVNYVSSAGIYQPHFFTKNVVFQFFVYAAVAALNYRDQRIGSLLETYELSTAVSNSLSLDLIIPHLIVPDLSWLTILVEVKEFFRSKKGDNSNTLFCYRKDNGSPFSFEIRNNAETQDTDVKFAYSLLEKYPDEYSRFDHDHRHLDYEKFNRKWQTLAYTDKYLPSIYLVLSKMSHFAKTSLVGFPSGCGTAAKIHWSFRGNSTYYGPRWDINRKEYWRSVVKFEVGNYYPSTKPNLRKQASYLLNCKSSNDKKSYQRLIIREDKICTPDSHFIENEIIGSQDEKPKTMDRIRYMQLGFLQSEPRLKLERLYIALKDKQLDFRCEEESILIKQTLFEVSSLMKTNDGLCGLTQWTVKNNPTLIHKLGLLLIDKALGMKHCLTQHHVVGNILEVVLGLLTFYPSAHKDEFIEGVTEIYQFLKEVSAKPPSHLSKQTILHLNAYLVISVQAKPKLLETETLTVLEALSAIQNYKGMAIRLSNSMLFRVRVACYSWYLKIKNQLELDPTVLNNLMSSLKPDWDDGSTWQKHEKGLLYNFNDHTIEPLLGGIYFQNRPIEGLPDSILCHKIFQEYFGEANFAVKPDDSHEVNGCKVPCYLSVGNSQITRLTLIQEALIIEEYIAGDFQQYVPVQELSKGRNYPSLLYASPDSAEKFTHWLCSGRKILVKNQNREIIYEWNLGTNLFFSLQHQGHVVPWEQLQDSSFKTWLGRIELPGWIEIIASPHEDTAQIKSLHFLRLGLHFDLKRSQLFSRQIHGYTLAKGQHINTLHGFLNYFVLEKEAPSCQLTKVVIPHRQIELTGSFGARTAVANHATVLSPAYFVYDYDPKTGLLKAQHTRAKLYLALLYYCTASLDDHDSSHINAYQLAKENLDTCWKDQPFDEIELNVITQFLSPKRMRNFHSHRVALYLKVVSMLSSSMRLGFLYTDKTSVQNKETSEKVLSKCDKCLPYLLSQYVENKPKTSLVLKLSLKEEEELMDRCPNLFQAYRRLYFKQATHAVASEGVKKSYKDHYGQLFSEDALRSTSFFSLFTRELHKFKFVHCAEQIDFSSGFNKILLNRFQLNDFIALYKYAKSSEITTSMYSYLLHHVVYRSKINYDRFPAKLVMMLARALLLVAENPELFPELPDWFEESVLPVVLSKRFVIKELMLDAFGDFVWEEKTYDTWEERERAWNKARIADENENEKIWSKLESKDLDSNGVPSCLPSNFDYFSLNYENWVYPSRSKRDKVKQLYLEAAVNDAMYQFFVEVMELCDEQKHNSNMGWSIAPFTDNPITRTFTAERSCQPKPQPASWENWAIPQEPLIVLDEYFSEIPRVVKKTDFLFESQLEKPESEYQHKFCSELKGSWEAYHDKSEPTYSWRNVECMSELEALLRKKYDKFHEQAIEIWDSVSAQFKNRPNSESDGFFALRWYSGKVSHYHKEDLLKLLIEPSKLASYNPNCEPERDRIIKNLLNYVSCEINAAKVSRLSALLAQMKGTVSETEKYSLLQGLVTSVQECLTPASFRNPHWLLFQFENEIIVRENQRELIEDMLNQTEKAMYQLNMGEGKSSVILPLLCHNLANGQQVLRINVLPSLLITMKNFLRQRFSGLIRKHIYALPFHRDTDISPAHLKLIFEALETCQEDRHILLVTAEHRLCLQLKLRELMIENQQQVGATNVFNWKTYRERVPCKNEVYKDLKKSESEDLLKQQSEALRSCLQNEKYIDPNDIILKLPPRGQGSKEFARFRDIIDNPNFREWSCLKAAYKELLYNSTLGHVDSTEKLALLEEVNALPAIDLLDESDEILRHGTELNYTMGDKHLFAGGDLRWEVPQFFIQAMFCDNDLKEIITQGISDGFTVLQLNYSPHGGVPFVQLLDVTYYDRCIKPVLIEKFLAENLLTLREYNTEPDSCLFEDQPSSLKQYIAGELEESTEKKVLDFLSGKGQLNDKILIAKGWLSHGILFHVFNAKYRVQYGLNLYLHNESQVTKPIAIPFFGKDAPSLRSEFSHPDVMLGFTIISYLYEGLSQHQLKKALTQLSDKFCSNVADQRLQDWVEAGREWIEPKTESFPPRLLKSLQHMDLSDELCLAKLHQYLRGNHRAILFYLNQFIFLQEAMQYLHKISANAHSMVGYNGAIGFSGTDDRKLTMPFRIKSLRSPSQEGTNGKLLSVLMEDRNSRYIPLKAEDTTNLLAELCGYVAQQSHCHALIDAGALVTGLTNHETASFLLCKLPAEILGVMYFSDVGNNLTVLTRDNKTMLREECYLDKQNLFAYLDDVHTRGTDLKLPLNCHAILTVSMGMQKDKLMQAAMRLRQLAQKQSISLFGTQAVTLAIARDNSVDTSKINSSEVIKWVTRNTVDQINTDLFPVTVRKINFQFSKKAEAWLKEAPTSLGSLVKYCQDKELFSLEEFYGASPQACDLTDCLYRFVSQRISDFWQEIEEELTTKQLVHTALYRKVTNKVDKENFRKELLTICEEVGIYLLKGYVQSSLDNDEEKEVEVEIIKEQEVIIKVESRSRAEEKDWDFRSVLDEDFIAIAEKKNIIMPVNAVKRFIQMPVSIRNIIWHPDVYMTNNFIESTKAKQNEAFDNYLRPVDVMLINRRSGKSRFVLLSGKEAAQIKTKCYEELDDSNLLLHLHDVDGPTQLPPNNFLNAQELKLLLVVKLFAGECHYPSPSAKLQLSKLVGRLCPECFVRHDPSVGIDVESSKKLFKHLIEEKYIGFLGTMVEKLLTLLRQVKSGESVTLQLTKEYEPFSDFIMKELSQIHAELIVQPFNSMRDNYNTIKEWVGTRGRLKEYVGSELESILKSG